MAEFVQTMKDMRRMCDAHASNCCECPLASYECAYTPIHRLYFTDKQVEAIVATWAADHPEPVYPTWLEFVKAYETGEPKSDSDFIYWMGTTSIPADIAKRLEIKPEES